MKNILLLLILYSSNSLAAGQEQSKLKGFEFYKAQIVCESVCYQDQDDKGIIIEGRCYCANLRDTSRIVQRVMTKPTETKGHKLDSTIQW